MYVCCCRNMRTKMYFLKKIANSWENIRSICLEACKSLFNNQDWWSIVRRNTLWTFEFNDGFRDIWEMCIECSKTWWKTFVWWKKSRKKRIFCVTNNYSCWQECRISSRRIFLSYYVCCKVFYTWRSNRD